MRISAANTLLTAVGLVDLFIIRGLVEPEVLHAGTLGQLRYS